MARGARLRRQYLPGIPSIRSKYIAVEVVYEDQSILERRSLEAKAKYLMLMLNAPSLPWSDFEAKYEIYPRAVFHLHTQWTNKRKEWIELLGLNYKPFEYIKIAPTDEEKEALESAWASKSSETRQSIERKAQHVADVANPLFQLFSELESLFGYSEDKEKYFKKDLAGYMKNRDLWFEAIGIIQSDGDG